MKGNCFFLLLLLIACNNSQQVLPKSTGSEGEIIVVATDILWSSYPANAIKKTFSKDYPGLQQVEPFYNIIRIKPNEFSSIFKTHKNIILILKNKKTSYKNNLWASPQQVLTLSWESEKNNPQLLKACEKNLTRFYKNKLVTIKSKYTKLNLEKAYKKIRETFRVEVKIPVEYVIVKDTTNIFWASYNPQNKDLIKQILIFSLETNEINDKESLTRKVNEVLKQNIKGPKADSFVQIEQQFPLLVDSNTYRGLWNMENSYMGGPFLMKTYNINEKIIVCIGMIFAPGKLKKEFMTEMDAIL